MPRKLSYLSLRKLTLIQKQIMYKYESDIFLILALWPGALSKEEPCQVFVSIEPACLSYSTELRATFKMQYFLEGLSFRPAACACTTKVQATIESLAKPLPATELAISTRAAAPPERYATTHQRTLATALDPSFRKKGLFPGDHNIFSNSQQNQTHLENFSRLELI